MSMTQRATIHVLQGMNLKAERAWSLKETAMDIWRYVSRHHADAALREWASRAMRSRLAPIKRCARMIREHLWGIVNAMALGVTNACSESVNAKVQRVKRSACGFRNRERFKNAILFQLGRLDLYPATASVTHTSS